MYSNQRSGRRTERRNGCSIDKLTMTSKTTRVYIPELKLTIYCSPNKVAEVRKRYKAAVESKKVTIGSNLRTGLKHYNHK